MTNNILLSFIIPVYKVEQYVEECLNSILSQGLNNGSYEIIIVDDGSPDRSGEICEQFAAAHPEVDITIIHQENQGVSGARNHGLEHARGEYVYFIDSDDFLVPDSIPKVLDIAVKNKPDVVCFNVNQGVREVLLQNIAMNTPYETKYSSVMNGDEYIASHNFLATVWWYFTRREYLKRLDISFPVGHNLEDGNFTPIVLLHAQRIKHVNVKVYCYVNNDKSVMRNKSYQKHFDMLPDYVLAAKTILDETENYKSEMCQTTYDRLTGLGWSYTYWGLIKSIRLNKAKDMIKLLKKDNLYPVGKLHEQDYPGKRIKIIRFLINNESICCLLGYLIKPFWGYEK